MRSWGAIVVTSSPKNSTRPRVAGDDVEQGGLARAIRADHGAALARGDRDRDVLDRRERAEDAGDALQAERVTRRGAVGRHYGQFGSSREPTLNSSFFMPRSWFTPSILRSTRLYRLPCGSFATSVMKVVPIAWRFSSSFTSPTGVLSVIFESASRYFFCPSPRSPFTISRPSSAAFMLM